MTFRHFIYSALLLLLLSVSSLSAFAFSYTIKGTAKGLTARSVYLYSPSWFERKEIPLDAEGNFFFAGSQTEPAMFALTYGEGFSQVRADIFLMSDIDVEAELSTGGPSGDMIFIRIPDQRSAAFKNAKTYMDRLYIHKPTGPSTLKEIVPFIMEQNYIKDDSLTRVYALASKLNYIMVMRRDYGRVIEHAGPSVFEMLEFFDLPINDPHYLGLEPYKNLMAGYNDYVLQDTKYRVQGTQKAASEFQRQLEGLEASRKQMPALLSFEVEKRILNRFDYKQLREDDKSIYLGKIFELTSKHTQDEGVQKFKEELDLITGSLVYSPAPSFELFSKEEELVYLSDLLKGNAILIDVWGSWCKPCRLQNHKLVKYHKLLKDEGVNISFVSIAKESSLNNWNAAIRKDNMSWTQLRASDQFVKDYKIRHFPTTILIDATGVVRQISPSVTLEEIRAICN